MFVDDPPYWVRMVGACQQDVPDLNPDTGIKLAQEQIISSSWLAHMQKFIREKELID